jgi:glucose-6-phosphate isomerase
MITFDYQTYRDNIITDKQISDYDLKIKDLTKYFEQYQHAMGWAQPRKLKDSNIVSDVIKTANYIRNNCDAFIVIGIGGSYLGSKAVIEALQPYFYNNKNKPEIYYVGNSLSSEYLLSVLNIIKNKNVIINYISKSGNTFETDTIYKLIMQMMNKKYSEDELKARIIFTTGNKDNIEDGYKVFEIPNNIGGRYSVFTPAGLLPIAVSGLNIEELFEGAIDSQKSASMEVKYAVIRDILYRQGKSVEAFVAYEPKLLSFIEWLKQLYAESLGKDKKGMLPIGLINTTDLHSLGQFIQEGTPLLFETVFNVKETKATINLLGNNLNEINNVASKATSIAHNMAGIVNNVIDIDTLDEYHIGYLMQYFMLSCAISGFLDNVNAFNQPGVEEYKRIMKELLNKKSE